MALIAIAAGVVALFVWLAGAASREARDHVYPIPTAQCGAAKDCDQRAVALQAREAFTSDAAMDIALGQLALSILGFAGVGFTVFYARLAWREARRTADVARETLNHMREDAKGQDERFAQQLALTKQSADAATAAAEAAVVNARISQAALIGGARPMMVLEVVDYSEAVPAPGQPTKSHPVTIKFRASNPGERNAIIEHFYAELVAARETEEERWPAPSAERMQVFDNFMAEDLVQNEVVVMPGANYPAIYKSYVGMEGDDLKDMWGLGERRLLLLVLIIYRDPLGVRRERGVTLIYSPLAKHPDQWWRYEHSTHNFDRIVDLGDLKGVVEPATSQSTQEGSQ